jgi:hypothetical protein
MLATHRLSPFGYRAAKPGIRLENAQWAVDGKGSVPDKGMLAARSGVTFASRFNAELPSNQFAKAVFDFLMARDRSLPTVYGVQVNIVVCPMSFQDASGSHQLLKEFSSIQTSTLISLLLTDAGKGDSCSSSISR